MKVMISQPMRGKTVDEIKEARVYAKNVLEGEGHTILNNIFDEDIEVPEGLDEEVYVLSKCIELIAEADAVVFIGDWHKSRGCQVEYQVATAYGKYIKILT